MEDGESREAIFDVACSDGLEPDPLTHRCGDNGARVNLTDCSVSRDKGATQLRATWTDPQALNPDLLRSVWGTAYASLWFDGHRSFLPVEGDAVRRLGTVTLLLALLPQLIAHSTFNWALRYLPAAYVSITTLGEPIGSTILAFLLLGERPTGLMLAGGILILTGIAVASRPDPALRSQSEETQTR